MEFSGPSLVLQFLLISTTHRCADFSDFGHRLQSLRGGKATVPEFISTFSHFELGYRVDDKIRTQWNKDIKFDRVIDCLSLKLNIDK